MRKHEYCLDELVENLSLIAENPLEAQWIMREGIWMMDDSTNKHKLCDLIIGYYQGTTLIELKSGRNKKFKASEQLASSLRFSEEILDKPVIQSKIIYYNKDAYEYDLLYRNAELYNSQFKKKMV